MSNIQLDIPNTRVVIRQPAVIVDRSRLPIQSVAEFALTSSYANYAKNVDAFNIGIVGDISASGGITASTLYVADNFIASGSANVDGNLLVTGNIFATSISGSFFGLINSASFSQVALTVLQDTFTGSFSGSYYGDGSNLVFSSINTNQSSVSTLTIGNIFNNYQYSQTTIFRNSNIVASGSITVSSDGLLILQPRNTPIHPIAGALFYSSSGEFFVGL